MNQLLQGNESVEKIRTTDGIGNGNSFEVSFSSEFVDMLDVLQHQLKNLKYALNEVDITDLWRSLISHLDPFVFTNIPLSNAKFSHCGIC
jgi:hypothetical protein